MPSVPELAGRNYYVNVTSSSGNITYMNRRQLFFRNEDFGFLFVKTDKPIYKPEQEGEELLNADLDMSLSLSLSLSLFLSLSPIPPSWLQLFFCPCSYPSPVKLWYTHVHASLHWMLNHFPVKFCLAFVDKTLKPHQDDNTVSLSTYHTNGVSLHASFS